MSLATFITNAVIKVSTDEAYANMEFATREEARANFVAALLFELGLGPQPAAVHAPVQEPKEEKQAPKKRAPKKAKEEAKVEEAKVEEKKEEAPAKKARKTKAKAEEVKVEEEAPAADSSEPPMANAGAAPEPAKVEKKKPGPKPKAKLEGPVNIEKLTPTHKKHIKKMAEELQCGIDDKAFLAYANGMSADAWGAKSLDEHIREFVGPLPGATLAPPPTEFEVVEFKGVEYLVDPATKFVYENVPEGAPVRNKLGVVGLLEFAEMEM